MSKAKEKLDNNEPVSNDIEITKLFTFKFRISDLNIKKKWRQLSDLFSKTGR